MTIGRRRNGKLRRRMAIGGWNGNAELRAALVEQRRHLTITNAPRRTAHHHPDQPVSFAYGRGGEVEPGGVDVTRLEPVRARIPIEQMVVTDDNPAAKFKFSRRKIAIF